MNRVQNTKIILWLITGFAAAVGLNRFIFGLGATTNLTDSTPWGLWIGFDVMGGVALAAGGFVMTAIFYIMKREEFHPLVKPAVLTAFLGYMAVILGLLFDLGLPWNIWHMIIFWNPHSPLFEVGWCVMLYSAVLLLEFSPVPLEKYSRYAKIRNFLMKFRFVFVLLGIMLSTLHQSSLGSLFLIMPFKLHPLWYSNILPIQFFLSAVALGLMMVAFESLASHWLYKRKPETSLVEKLGKTVVWVLSIYLIVKIIDILAAGEITIVLNGSWESFVFISEIFISIIFPIIIFSVPKMRRNIKAQWIGSFMVVFGMVFNRINVGGLTMLSITGDSYTPSWMEITISLGVVSAAALVFLFVIEHFNIWDLKPQDPESLPHTAPSFDYSSHAWLGTPDAASLTKFSLAFVLSFAVGMALMPEKKLHGKGIEEITVSRASGIERLLINGNKDDNLVEFPHKEHIARLGEDQCAQCHHLTLPRFIENSCWECHTNMYKPVDYFKHNWHASSSGANIKCDNCHVEGVQRESKSAKNCVDCHPKYDFNNARFIGSQKYFAISYTDAFHQLCVSCHFIKADELNKQNLTECKSCHKVKIHDQVAENLKWKTTLPHFNSVILPNIEKEKNQSEMSKDEKENINN
ncbi:MAG: Ni/Fe-hydrogenase cytochrome b subunit [Ignavibacteriaceae bacterium]|nr:Ni/Fe-hydrogenase cytochrome b subunit [Ignavibacteriaceae bacterium]